MTDKVDVPVTLPTLTDLPATPATPATQTIDIEALKIQIAREYEAQHSAKLKELTGASSLNELNDKKLKEQGDYLTLVEQSKSEVVIWKNKYNDSIIKDSIVNASIANNVVDHEVLYSLIKSQSKIDDLGIVTINGKSPTDYVKEYLSDKQYLVKPSTKVGSGTPSASGPVTELAQLKLDYDAAYKSGDFLKALDIKTRIGNLST